MNHAEKKQLSIIVIILIVPREYLLLMLRKWEWMKRWH